jgi:hypothetical protein
VIGRRLEDDKRMGPSKVGPCHQSLAINSLSMNSMVMIHPKVKNRSVAADSLYPESQWT